MKGLSNPNPQLRERALNGIGQFDTPEALDGIVRALRDSSPDVRQRALRLVSTKISRPSDISKYTDTFISLTGDSVSDVRQAAASALGDSRDPKAIPTLTALLKDPQRPQSAARALGQIADPSSIDALTAALKDAEDPEVREMAAIALAQNRARTAAWSPLRSGWSRAASAARTAAR